jgi:hypothetical protein
VVFSSKRSEFFPTPLWLEVYVVVLTAQVLAWGRRFRRPILPPISGCKKHHRWPWIVSNRVGSILLGSKRASASGLACPWCSSFLQGHRRAVPSHIYSFFFFSMHDQVVCYFCPYCDSFRRLIHIRCIRIHPDGWCSTLNFCIVDCSSTCYATVASALQMLDKMSLGKSSMHTHSPSWLMLIIKFWYPGLV